MRHFEVKDVLSWATREEAKHYIGQTGFFGDSLAELAGDVETGDHFLLSDVQDDTSSCFYLDGANYYSFFLPADKVKEVEEKKWRPFKDRVEFKEVTGLNVGDTILFKEKNYVPCCSNEAFILSLENEPAGLMFVTLSGLRTSNKILFDKYEYSKDEGETWLPFGVEE